ncbi:MAG: rhomboid family intramembrane serine protease [Armatimonadetes bacterium]|nr:rhomboid family intramembrane serine protease [Armatimonadota bacterium]
MIPLRDDNPTTLTPYVTWALVAINAVVFFNQEAHGLAIADMGPHRFAGLMQFAMVPAYVTGLKPHPPVVPDPYLTIFTSMFMHGGWLHIIGNMVYLLIFGNNIEDRLGHVKYLVFYLGSGFLAALAHIVSEPSSSVPTVGASGAIAGVLGAYILLYPNARVYCLVPFGFVLTTMRVPAFFMLGIWILTQIGSAYLQSGAQIDGGVAYWAHIGGFASGIILLILLGGWHKTGRGTGRLRKSW